MSAIFVRNIGPILLCLRKCLSKYPNLLVIDVKKKKKKNESVML